MMRVIAAIVVVLSLSVVKAQAATWVRSGLQGKTTRWGMVGGLQFAIPPSGSGPRGLVRVYGPTLDDGKYDLVNFIAVEPIVGRKRGLSELETSELDGVQGKRFWVEANEPAAVTKIDGGVEMLRVVVHVEPFSNGAKVKLVVEQRSDRPDEMGMMIVAEEGCAEMESCILTATMGNKARTRLLWLKEETIDSRKIFADYRGRDFAETVTFPVSKIATNRDGDLITAVTTDEARPADVHPFGGTSRRWYWGGRPVTQYWKVPRGSWDESMRVSVNGRFMYWASTKEIPGGVAFENFEMRQRFGAGQRYIFGITDKSPADLGIGSSSTPHAPSP